MGKCIHCGTPIDDCYKFCLLCSQKNKAKVSEQKEEPMKEIIQQLKFLNWNLGAIRGILTKDKKLVKKIKEAENEVHK